MPYIYICAVCIYMYAVYICYAIYNTYMLHRLLSDIGFDTHIRKKVPSYLGSSCTPKSRKQCVDFPVGNIIVIFLV